MRTTLVLDEPLIKELMALTGARTKTEAVHLAVSELIRSKKRDALKALSGKITLDENWQALEEVGTTAHDRPEDVEATRGRRAERGLRPRAEHPARSRLPG